MPERFLHCEQAQTLDEGTFDLSVVDGGVDGATYVHFHVSAEAGPVSRQSVDFDSGRSDALSEVEEHLAGIWAPDVAWWLLVRVLRKERDGLTDVRCLVEAVGREIDAVEVGGMCELLHGGVLA